VAGIGIGTSVVIHLLAENEELVQSLKESESGILRFAGFALDHLTLTVGEVTDAINGLISTFQRLFAQYDKQIQAEVQLESVLRATGNASGFTARQLKEQAKELQDIISVSDEVILKVQGVLSTFNRIEGTNFQRVTKAAFDMAAVLDTDVVSSAIRLGKALQQPIKGIERLERVGLELTEAQKKLVEGFIAIGETSKAAEVILGSIEERFKGVAEAQAKTLGGQLNSLVIRLKNLNEQLFKALAPFAKIVVAVIRPILSIVEILANALLPILESIGLIITTIFVTLFGSKEAFNDIVQEWVKFLELTERGATGRLNREKDITEELGKQLQLTTSLEQFAFDIEKAAETRRIKELKEKEGGEEDKNKELVDAMGGLEDATRERIRQAEEAKLREEREADRRTLRGMVLMT